MEHSNTFLSRGGIHWDMPISLNIIIARFVDQIVLYRYENTSIYIFCWIQYTYINIFIYLLNRLQSGP